MTPRIAVCVLVGCLSSSAAFGDVAVESYRGRRPADAERVLAPLRDELDRAGVKVRATDVVAAVGGLLPLPGVSDPAPRPSYAADLRDQAEAGAKQVFHGNYDEGVATLERVLAGVRDNPAAVVVDDDAPTWLTKTYATLAFGEIRRRDMNAATAAIAEQFRSFPELPIARLVGPEVAALSDAVRKTLETTPRGRLRVVVSQTDVQVFVNERVRGQGRAFLDLVPGTYRVLLVRQGVTRRRTVVVVAGHDTDVPVDWDADAAFSATPTWIGFVWPQGSDKSEPAMSRYARASTQHDVVTIGIASAGGRRFVVGKIFEKTTGVLLRHKVVELGIVEQGHADDVCERALARYLVTGTPAICLRDPLGTDLPPVHDDVVRDQGPRTASDPYLLSGITFGAGAVAAVGGFALLIDRYAPRSSQDPSARKVSSAATALMVGGGLAIGTAVYLASRVSHRTEDWGHELRRSRAPIYAAAGTAIAAFAAGGYLLHINGEGTCGLSGADSCKYNYATASHGWALLGAGAAAVGFGVYWHLGAPADGQIQLNPIVSAGTTESRAVVSLGGSF